MNAPMNTPAPDGKSGQTLMLADCDIHPIQKAGAMNEYLSAQWREHMATFGPHVRQGLAERIAWPRMMASGQRIDAYPAAGGPPGSSYEMLRDQHLDPHGVEHGMLIALSKGGMEERNQDFAAALMHATNQWQKEQWVDRDPRLHAGIVVTPDDAHAAAKEIALRAKDKAFSQVITAPRANEPLGRRRFWPIFAIAEEAGLPIGLHPAAHPGGAPSTGLGWPSYYMQEHYTFATACEAQATSLVMEGVFEEFPKLKIAMIESGFQLGSDPGLAHGPHLGAHAQGGPAPQASAFGISARAFLVCHPADGRTGKSATPDGRLQLDWLGQDHVFVGLSALGL